ncbi:putative E3 UFM1-protein ligase 1 [Plasmopara halstedii]
MDEIALLQQQLAAVQQQETALKLSDHNVVDLLLKLQQSGKLRIIHTRTGKQFLTPLQVQREIADYVALHGGRLSFTELEKLIDVDRTYVVNQAAVLFRNSRGNKDTYHVVNDGEELLTNWYIDGIIEDTNVLLQESGTTSIGALAQQFGFAVDYMRDVVRSRLGSILMASEKNNVLYTDSYVAAQRAQTRGVFAAITRPVFIPDILKNFGFDETVATDVLTELIKTKVLMGTIKNREYIPFVFMDAQRNSVYSFFQQNGYLEHARAREIQVVRPYDFLKKRFQDAIPLRECVVSRDLQLQLEGAVEAAISDNMFVDVRLLLPSALSSGDVSLLLSLSPALKKVGNVTKVYQIAETYAVSSGFFALYLTKFEEDATIKASRALTQQKSNAVLTKDGEVNSDGETTDSKRGKKGKRMKSDQNDSSWRNGKTTQGKKDKRGPKRSGNASEDGESSSTSTRLSITPSHDETLELLLTWCPALDDCKDDDEFLNAMVAHLKPNIDEMYSAALTKAMSSTIRGDAASLRELRKAFEDLFDEQFSLLIVLEKGFHKLSMLVDAKDVASMEQLALVETHILKSFATELASLFTCFIAESNNLEVEGVPPMASLRRNEAKDKVVVPITSLSDDNRKVFESKLSQSTANSLVRLWTLATAGRHSISDFMAHIPVLADDLSMPLRKMDRKKERQIIFGYRQATLAELENQTASVIECNQQYALLATLILQLFFQQLTGLPCSFPRETLSYGESVLQALKGIVPEKAVSIIQDFVLLAGAISNEENPIGEEKKAHWSKRLANARAVVLSKDLGSIE